MGQALCICARGSLTIDNKKYYFVQKLDEGWVTVFVLQCHMSVAVRLYFMLPSNWIPPWLSSGFSYVDLVEGAKDGRFYALKKILCHDRQARQEAQTEVEMHQMFNHQNILSLVAYAFVDSGGKTEAWLLLPYIRVSWRCNSVDERNLSDCDHILMCLCEQKGTLWCVLEKLRDKGSLMPENQILKILRGICSGLKAIHDKGYAHR